MSIANDDDEVELWTREENSLLTIRVSPEIEIQIAQYGSNDDRWGIYSCVWDGGLGLIEYLRQEEEKTDTVVVDLGSGTGIVGLGLAALGISENVVLTDLPDATSLLQENCKLNPSMCNEVVVEELSWGTPPSRTLSRRMQESKGELLILGADIVYRQNLFDPLLDTLMHLWEEKSSSTKKCRFATQSLRQHLKEFWEKARQRGFQMTHVANVIVPQGLSTDLPQVVPASDTIGPGIVQIIQIER